EKFIEFPALSGLDIDDLNRRKLYGGLMARLEIDNTDHHRMPTNGIRFFQEIKHLQALNDNSRDVTSFHSELALYWTFFKLSRITWATRFGGGLNRSEEHTSELQSRENLVCRLLLEKKK